MKSLGEILTAVALLVCEVLDHVHEPTAAWWCTRVHGPLQVAVLRSCDMVPPYTYPWLKNLFGWTLDERLGYAWQTGDLR